jgi:general secretion pathway protein A
LYQNFYHLKENPFRLSPDPSFMCMTVQHQEALSGLIYSVCARSGLTVLLGEAGTGKTTLLYTLLGLLEKRRCVTALCTNTTLSREEFYDLLMIKFGVECSSPLKSRQLMAFEEVLRRNRAEGRLSVLIVDEGQRLSTELLEEVRLLLNLENSREKLLEIIIAGQPELGDVLRRPELRQLKQRISSVCRLQSLSSEELKEYLNHRLLRAGLPSQKLFSETVIEKIYDYTQGIPRLVNSLCDGSLQTGFALQSHCITTAIVEEVAKDLDLIPARIAENFTTGMLPPDADTVSRPGPATRPEPHLKSAKPMLVNAVATNRSADAATGPLPAGGAAQKANLPDEEYASRQKSLGFFAGLMDRLKISNG